MESMRTRREAPPALDEAALLDRARQGDEDAFRELVDAYRDRIYALALRVVRSSHDAEDVAQEAFVRAWLGLPRFRGESSFYTWLCSIATRRAIDRAASLQARRARERDVEEAESLAAPGSPEEEAMLGARRLVRLLDLLTPTQRAAITLFYWEGRSTREVATALQAPEGTVKTHLSRARAILRRGWMQQERRRPA